MEHMDFIYKAKDVDEFFICCSLLLLRWYCAVTQLCDRATDDFETDLGRGGVEKTIWRRRRESKRKWKRRLDSYGADIDEEMDVIKRLARSRYMNHRSSTHRNINCTRQSRPSRRSGNSWSARDSRQLHETQPAFTDNERRERSHSRKAHPKMYERRAIPKKSLSDPSIALLQSTIATGLILSILIRYNMSCLFYKFNARQVIECGKIAYILGVTGYYKLAKSLYNCNDILEKLLNIVATKETFSGCGSLLDEERIFTVLRVITDG